VASTAHRSRERSTGGALTGGLTADEVAWIAAIPTALLALGAIVLLGPPLGRLLWPPPTTLFWPGQDAVPEPTEHARFLLALAAPVVLSAAVIAVVRGRPQRRFARTARGLAWIGQALALAFAIAGVVAQHMVAPYGRTYFTPSTLAASVALVCLLALVLHSERVTDLVERVARETRRHRVAAASAVLVLTAVWLLTAFNSDGSIGRAHVAIPENVPYWLDETFSVLEGGGPLVTFNAQYATLWPYLTAAVMSLLGTSLGVYSLVMLTGTGIALVAVYATFRRVVRSSLLALALYVPFLANGFFQEQGPLSNRYSPANLFSLFPMRYGGPFVLLWLLARHLDGARPHQRIWLFVVAGIVVINNVEFGVPALGATIAALAWTARPVTWRFVARLAGDAVLGVAGAVVLVSLLTLVVAGSLPDFTMLVTFPRIYGVLGFGMLPMPTSGFHLSIYLTFAAVIVAATVRAIRRDPDILLIGLLVWSGVFGLGAGSYYVGRSHPEVLIDIFSAWSLALGLLLVIVVRAIAARPRRWPAPAEVAVMAGFALTVCSIAQTPLPWTQIERIARHTPTPRYAQLPAERFIDRETRPGERVLILASTSHRMAYDVGIVNVSPYATFGSMPTVAQLGEAIDALRAAGGHTIFFSTDVPQNTSSPLAALYQSGVVSTGVRGAGVYKLRLP
jgi:hypothetical protein